MLINIFGLPATGKSTLRNGLLAALGKEIADRIPGDHYLKSKPKYQHFKTYFHKDQYDWELLKMHLNFPLDTTISTPLFDYTKFIRISEHGNKSFTIKKILILDTAAPCPFADIKLLIALDSKERLRRTLQRQRDDEVWKEITLKNWEESENKLSLYNTDKLADFILDGNEEIEKNVKKVIKEIKY